MDGFVPPRGMRDFFPDDLLQRDRIFNTWMEAAHRHGFHRYEAPVVETFDLLARKAGEEVSRQIYDFEDKSNRRLALRPEVTPSFVRMVSARQGALSFPLKWTTIAQCFRYERMTKGRKREHYQWNLDIVGDATVFAESWILSAATTALRAMELSSADVLVRVNHRDLIAQVLTRLGVEAERHTDIFLIIDKRGKMPDSDLITMFTEKGFAASIAEELFALMDTGSLESVERFVGSESSATRDIAQLFAFAEALGFRDYLVFDPGIIRGLSYYTGIVFEAFDTQRRYRAIFGGGRYDRLFESMTGTARPAVGLGFGDVVIAEVLAERPGYTPAKPSVDVCVGVLGGDRMIEAAGLAHRLVEAGCRVETPPAFDKPGKFFSYANKVNARFAAFLGEDEIKDGAVALKDLVSGSQERVPVADAAAWVQARLKPVEG
ncbi:histidine--tRNA ligase [Pararhodospirillum oryzae]|uniref:Histidine--tRNA ligase n=1 Tax=Pararhodospirillum oryzae TaxID=478448 RepID=A0A512HBE0_9PROT|nr:histidine--tRNA ligase [Pararhodospirillum oryzae]GEO82771.1 histidine--tRNA ligase [Pararhodospirillum oryzae]